MRHALDLGVPGPHRPDLLGQKVDEDAHFGLQIGVLILGASYRFRPPVEG